MLARNPPTTLGGQTIIPLGQTIPFPLVFFGYGNIYQSPVFAYQNTSSPVQMCEWHKKLNGKGKEISGSGAGPGLQSKVTNSKSQFTHIQKHQFVSLPVTLEHIPLITSLMSL